MSWCSSGGNRVRCAFTVIEMLVALGVVVILLSIFIPYLLSVRERSNRTTCADKLRQIRDALQTYATDNEHNFPRVRYQPERFPNGYAAFTGPDEPDPFKAGSAVHPSDVTASLWLLVRTGIIDDTRLFVCPSSNDSQDRLFDPTGRAVARIRRGNFRSPQNLSYSYASPFSSDAGYRLNSDWLKPEFALMADKNPGRTKSSDVTSPAHDAQTRLLAKANSLNHDQAGQNVLFADGHVSFTTTAYCGAEGDNIYTALAPAPPTAGNSPPANGNGYIGRELSPVWNGDSFLVPTQSDPPVSMIPVAAPASLPATLPSTTPNG